MQRSLTYFFYKSGQRSTKHSALVAVYGPMKHKMKFTLNKIKKETASDKLPVFNWAQKDLCLSCKLYFICGSVIFFDLNVISKLWLIPDTLSPLFFNSFCQIIFVLQYKSLQKITVTCLLT